MTFRQIIDAVRSEFGFDASEPTIKAWINERYATLVVRAQWRLSERSLGTTTANVSEYTLDDAIQDLAYVTVGQSAPYLRVSSVEMKRLQTDPHTYLTYDEAGAFAPAHDAQGNDAIEIYPTPTKTGDTITGFVSLPPVDLSADGDVPKLPADFHKAIVDGAIAVGLERDAEQLQSASYFEQKYEAAIEGLRRRRIGRIGSGPVRIGIRR